MKASVKMTASVWLLKSGDQYDYSSSYKRETSASLSHSAAIYQQGNDIMTCGIGEQREGKLLAILVVVKGIVALVPPNAVGWVEKVWLIVRSVQKQSSLGYRLVEGDIIRLGLSQWEINEIHSVKIAHPTVSLHDGHTENHHEEGMVQCKICLSSEYDSTNPLIAPCKCKGSVQYVHVNCLDSWIGSQRCGLEMKYDKKYTWKNIVCSVCKSGLPMDIDTNVGTVHNIGVPKPKNEAYIGIRNMNSEGKEVHIWQWNGHNSLTIGSGSCNKIRLPEEGLSDEHAIIRSKNGCVYLQDHNSQFGSLVLIQKPLVLQTGEKVSVQCGNTVLGFTLKAKRNLFKCFSAPRLHSTSQDQLKEEIARVVKLFVGSVN